jgi:hypothetical protein
MENTTQLFVLNPEEVTHAYELPDDKIGIMKEFCDGITIAGVQDKENYKTATQALTKVRKTRTGIESKRKQLKEPFLDAGKLIDAEAKRLTALITPIEVALQAKIGVIDSESARIEAERKACVDEQMRVAGYTKQHGVFTVGKMIISEDMAYSATSELLALYIENGLAAKATEEAEQAELKRLRDLAAAQTPPPVQERTVTFETKQHGKTAVNLPNPNSDLVDPFAAIPTGPFAGNTTLVDDATIMKTQSPYEKGFFDCRNKVIAILNSDLKLTRAQWIERISDLEV